jgi:hypothetical protein
MAHGGARCLSIALPVTNQNLERHIVIMHPKLTVGAPKITKEMHAMMVVLCDY